MKRAAFILALALTACGMRQPLEPAQGQSLPPTPAMASRPPTSEELLAASPMARPARVDELLTRSEEREDDRFDLPPGDIPTGNSGEPPE